MLQLTVSLVWLITIQANDRCTRTSPPKVPKYHLIEKCHRSTLGILATANYVSLTSCQRLGIEKKGLALNFSPPEAIGSLAEGEESPQYTCQVLKCAESESGVSLVNDTLFDYYSLYAKPLPDINATCLPGIGMFSLLKKQNYTLAEAECRNRSGLLADVMSEQRTDAIAQLLSGATVDAAYVGIKSDNGSDYEGVSGYSLNCITYRAWEPGHPKRRKRKYGCVAATRGRGWRTLPCRTRLPALCELNPGGPYKKGSIFASRNQNDSMPETSTMLT